MKASLKKLTAALLALVLAFSIIGVFATEEVEAASKPGKPTISIVVQQNQKWKTSKASNGAKYRCKYTHIRINWSATGADGYEFYNSYFGSKNDVKTKKQYTHDFTQSQSAKGTYYFYVRAYKNVNGKKVYGPWSKTVYATVPAGKWEYYT